MEVSLPFVLQVVVVAVSAFAWLRSLSLQVFLFADPSHKAVNGLDLLASGWLGLLVLQPGWLANILSVYVVWALLTGRRQHAKMMSIGALVLALTSLTARQWWFDEGHDATPIAHLGPGLYLWLLSFLILFVGTWMVSAPNNRWRGP